MTERIESMQPAEITAIAALLVSLGGVLKIIIDNRRMLKKQEEQLIERRDQRKERLGDIVFERLQSEMVRLDKKLELCERQHEEDQKRITELEQSRLRREIQLAELSARIGKVDDKVALISTGIFSKFERGDMSGPNDG